MAKASTTRRRYGALIILAAALVAAVFIAYPYRPVQTGNENIELPKTLVYADDMVTRPLTALTYTRSKPLFSPERRPGAIDQVIENTLAPEIAKDVGEFQLKGTLEKGGDWFALIQSSTTPGGVWIPEGEHLDQWILEEVHLDHILLRSDEETATLTLYPGAAVPGRTLDVSE